MRAKRTSAGTVSTEAVDKLGVQEALTGDTLLLGVVGPVVLGLTGPRASVRLRSRFGLVMLVRSAWPGSTAVVLSPVRLGTVKQCRGEY